MAINCHVQLFNIISNTEKDENNLQFDSIGGLMCNLSAFCGKQWIHNSVISRRMTLCVIRCLNGYYSVPNGKVVEFHRKNVMT